MPFMLISSVCTMPHTLGVRERAKLLIVECAPLFMKVDDGHAPRRARPIDRPTPSGGVVVAAELESAGRAGNGIGHVVVAAVGMPWCPANSHCAMLKPYDWP